MDRYSEIDQNKFWSLFNKRNKKLTTDKLTTNSFLQVDNTVYRTNDDKLNVWTNYVATPYEEDTDDISYDVNHKEHIEETLAHIKSVSEKHEDCIVMGTWFAFIIFPCVASIQH